MTFSRDPKGSASASALLLSFLLLCQVFPAPAQPLANAGFEEARADGTPAGWTVLTGLDPARYGPPAHAANFDAIKPTVAAPGRGGRGHSLAFPAQGTWRCDVQQHSQGVIDDVLPGTDIELPRDFALRNPADNIEALR